MSNTKTSYMFPIIIRVITVALGFFSNILINRSLGLAVRGQYTTIISYGNFFQLVLNLGICFAYPVIASQSGFEEAKKSVLTIIWIQTFGLIVVSLIVFAIDSSFLVFSITIISTVMICNGQLSFIALIDDIYKRNMILFSSTVLFILGNLISFIIMPGRLEIVIGLVVLKNLFETWIIVKKFQYNKFSICSLNLSKVKTVVKIGFPTSILAILIYCNYNIDIFMLGWMKSGDTQIGIYGVAYSLTNMIWIIPDAFKELIYNKSAREEDHKSIIRLILLNIGICIIICAAFFVLGRLFLRITFGEQFVIAYKVTFVLFCGVVPMVAFKLIHPIYVNSGKPAVVSAALGITVVVNVILSYLTIPRFGALGAAMASVLSYLFCGIVFMIKFWNDYCKESVTVK